jgi:ssDNA-binding Zn-finger/Zn-ribbon topoisomerase 1
MVIYKKKNFIITNEEKNINNYDNKYSNNIFKLKKWRNNFYNNNGCGKCKIISIMKTKEKENKIIIIIKDTEKWGFWLYIFIKIIEKNIETEIIIFVV